MCQTGDDLALITLSTDFGTEDGYVGAMKGVLYRSVPGVQVVDITHDIPRHDVAHAAYVLAQYGPEFPPGTIHVVVVDPGVGGARKPVVGASRLQRFVGPNNGVFGWFAQKESRCFEIANSRFMGAQISSTFHGRDVFATAAAALVRGASLADAGPPVKVMPLQRPPVPMDDEKASYGVIVHVDRYGNAITDIPEGSVPSRVSVRCGRFKVAELARTYEDVPKGRPLAYAGSAGTMELAVREGSAADEFELRRGAIVTVSL